jgi:hypothetical protein
MSNKDHREPLFYVVVGKKRIGKTHTTKQLIKNYIKGVPATGLKPRKVLIMDVNNEFTEFKTIDPKDIIKFTVHPKVEARRISPLKPNGYPMSLDEIAVTTYQALKDFRGGMFIMEDIAKYVTDSLNKDIIGTLATNAHVDNDIIAHFQFLGKAGNPKIKATMNILRLHKTLDPVSRHKDKFEEYYEIIAIAETIVNNSYQKGMKMIRELKRKNVSDFEIQKSVIFDKYCRVYVHVDFDNENIKGHFTPEQFSQAIEDYIMNNPKETINKYMSRKNPETGKPFYTYKDALKVCRSELFEKYYGND